MEKRCYNFAAGPSAMPLEVLKEAQRDLLCYPGAGCSVMEMSHRSQSYQDIIDRAEATLRRLLNIPEDYAVLFLQGGATGQFSAIPMNLTHQGETTAYMVTGNFSGKAQIEAARWGNAVIVASSKDRNFTYVPKITPADIPQDAKYLHICGNNTIYGLTFNSLPNHGNVSIVGDWSSALLGKEIDIRDYELVYAGAQKNMGPAGLTITIVKKSAVLEPVDDVVPIIMRYKPQIDNGSMYNTPPCWSIYMAGLMFDWVESQGGVSAMEDRNLIKACALYDYIDSGSFYNNPVAKEDRSITNVVYTINGGDKTDELTAKFVAEAKDAGIINIKGHKLVGGLRASIYNGVTIEAVEYLLDFMKKFEKENA